MAIRSRSKFRIALEQALLRGLAGPITGKPGKRAECALGEFLGPNVDPNTEPTPEERDAGMGFMAGHCVGEASALKRAAIALTDPRARGVEVAVVRLLSEGFDIEDALRKANTRPERDQVNGCGDKYNVIEFTPRRT